MNRARLTMLRVETRRVAKLGLRTSVQIDLRPAWISGEACAARDASGVNLAKQSVRPMQFMFVEKKRFE